MTGREYDAARSAAWRKWATAYDKATTQAEIDLAFAIYDADVAVAVDRYMASLTGKVA